MDLQAVIFDIDGTLLDSVGLHARAWQEAFQHFGREVPLEQVRSQIGKGGDQLIPVFFSEDELNRYGEEMEKFRGELFKRKYLAKVKPFPKVRALFERIGRSGRRIALASSANADELENYKKLLHVEDLLDAQTSSDDAERSKPHPDIFQAALERLGTSASTSVVIGDSPFDAEAAGKLGLATIGVLCGGFPEAGLRSAGCFAIYEDPEDLLENYEKWAGESACPTG